MRADKQKKILITGASGLLGTTMAMALKNDRFQIFRQGRTRQSEYNCDLTQKKEAWNLIDRIRPDIVINLAALTDVDRCEQDINSAYRQNVLTAENIAEALNHWEIPLLIHFSTDQVYDSPGLNRENQIQIRNTYAMTKYAGELAAAKVPSVILRTNFFGPSLVPGRSSFSDWVILALKNQTPISAFTDIRFNPVSMSTLCRITTRIIKAPVTGIFNVGSRGPMTKADFIFKLAKALKLSTARVTPGTSEGTDLKARRPKNMSMDCSLFESAYGTQLPGLEEEISSLTMPS